ncbi:MAG: glycosyltransferase family 2 protein [Candidatus Omnitrophica bacterium]|nr:glycosyltransferase family 2 protein [Candidatus Omnitrophota bacterium]
MDSADKTWCGVNIFVVIPAYNEAKTIGYIVNGLLAKGFRVVVVDDGSKDNTIIEANRYGAELILRSNNSGKGRCVREGFEYALEEKCDVVITMDGDGQHDFREIEKFLDEYRRSGADIVLGNRMSNPRKMPFIRRCTNSFMSFIISLILGRKIRDSQCGYRLLSRNALEKMSLKTAKYEIESEILLEAKRLDLKVSSVDIDSIYQGESSQINPFFDTLRFMRFIIYESLRKNP